MMGTTKSKIAFEICAVTGDFRADDMGPTVHIVLFDTEGHQSPTLTLDNLLQREGDQIQAKFTIDKQKWSNTKLFSAIDHIEFWRINVGLPLEWYIEKVIIRDRRKGLGGNWEYFFFPVHRWALSEEHIVVHNCETMLPKDERYPELRENELIERQKSFIYHQRTKGFPVELAEQPDTETFSYDTQWDIEAIKFEAIERNGLTGEYNSADGWPSFDALWNIYKLYSITEPMGLQHWMMNDICFGAQRLKGCNPFVLKLCTDIPENFGVALDWIKPQLEGWTVKHILDAKRLYIVDYKIMEGLECKHGRTFCAPLALFFFTEKRQLKPLAIQLNQEIEEGNPVFCSTDSPNAWMQAKLWFNLVDAVYHTVVVRLLNHLILEGIYAALRRNMAQSHPVYKFIAPYFKHFLAVNKRLKEWVFSSEGWIAQNIQLSKKGIRQLLKRAFKKWRFDINANIHRELEVRGVYDMQALSVYPYRDDGILVHNTIQTYITKYLKLYYPRGRPDLLEDTELQNWRREVAGPMEDGGLGLKGVPGGLPSRHKVHCDTYTNGDLGGTDAELAECLTSVEDTTKFLSGLVYLSVIVCGSASRLGMYDEYGCPAHYPLSLMGPLPEDPLTQRGEGELGGGDSGAYLLPVLNALPNRHATIDVLLSMRFASKVAQLVIAHAQKDYVFDPRAVALMEEFRTKLAENSGTIAERNRQRDAFHKYWCLDPSNMPNSPGI